MEAEGADIIDVGGGASTLVDDLVARGYGRVTVLDIADAADLSRRQVERLFRQEMGRSPARYYLEIRLDRARHLLVQSAMPVVEVAVACGFVSASHFSKCYREIYNRTPQQERAERKRKDLTLDVLSNNPARKLYERLGFKIVTAANNTVTMRF